MSEYVIVITNNDGDIVGVITPTDPLNPQFDIDELEKQELTAETYPLNSLKDFEEN